ncbi:hypothetical protein F4860DRAFT_511931 [Xylaria cubensis]|nr:hypothetical protein F4860DRAFT_511931 [Xylaria cubensis]
MVSSFVYRCSLEGDSIVVKQISPDFLPQSLKIQFKRTIRVPDNADEANLPPDLGNFHLLKACDFNSKLPVEMAAKGGVLFPMYQREAMWISFTATEPFMIKVYAGGVNAVSGEHKLETIETKMRRLDLVSKYESIQDYIVAPRQHWIDGFAVSPGVVRQFVAMPLGTGYTVEAQLTGQELVGGLQLEITPSLPGKRIVRLQLSHTSPDNLSIEVKAHKMTVHIQCSPSTTIKELSELLRGVEGLKHQHLMLNGMFLHNWSRTLGDFGVKNNAVLRSLPSMRGGGYSGRMGVAAGGKINQVIREDDNDPKIWATTSTIAIPVHILSVAMFRDVIGREPPPCPISAATYVEAGLPFFDLPENPSGISGAFDRVKSVNEINVDRGIANSAEPTVKPPVVTIRRDEDGAAKNYVDPETVNDPDGLVSPDGPLRAFRTLKDIRDELNGEDESVEGLWWEGW